MKKLRKNLIKISVLGVVFASLAATVVACSNNTANQSVKQFDFVGEIKIPTSSQITLLKPDLQESTDSTVNADVMTVNATLSDKSMQVMPTIKSTAAQKSARLLTKDDIDFTPSANLPAGVTQSIGIVTFDARFNTVANVQIKITKGQATAYYVAQIPGTPAPSPANFRKQKTVFLAGDNLNPRWIQATDEAASVYKNLGYIGISGNRGDTTGQTTFLNGQKDADSYVVAAFQAGSVNANVTEALNAGKPFIAYDRLITGTQDIKFYATYDNDQVGFQQGLALASALVGSPTRLASIEAIKTYMQANPLASEVRYLQLAGDPGDNNAPLFYGGAERVLSEIRTASNGKIIAVGGNKFQSLAITGWINRDANARITQQINNLSDAERETVKGILSPNDGFAIASLNSLRSAGLDPSKIYITGQDAIENALPELEKGNMNQTIIKPDTSLQAITFSMAAWLSDNNVDLKTIINDDAKIAQMAEFVAVQNPTSPFRVDKTFYDNDSGNVQGTNIAYAPVTFVLTPIVVDTANFSQFYKASQSA